MLNNQEILDALNGLSEAASLIAGDAIRYGISLEESYIARFKVEEIYGAILSWLGEIKDECKSMTSTDLYVCREHMPK